MILAPCYSHDIHEILGFAEVDVLANVCAIFPKNGTSMSTWGISIYLSIYLPIYLSIYNIYIYIHTHTHFLGMFMNFHVFFCWGFPKSPSAPNAPSRKPRSTAWARTNEPPGGGLAVSPNWTLFVAGAWGVLRFTWE